MIVDIRTYTCHAHKLTDWVALYKETAWGLQKQYLGKCRGWYITAEGRLNTVIHIWEYASQADREERRGAMARDPRWLEFIKRSRELGAFVSQENVMARPSDFFLADSGG